MIDSPTITLLGKETKPGRGYPTYSAVSFPFYATVMEGDFGDWEGKLTSGGIELKQVFRAESPQDAADVLHEAAREASANMRAWLNDEVKSR